MKFQYKLQVRRLLQRAKVQCDRLIQVRQKKKSRWDFANGDRDRLTEVEITVHQEK